MLSYKIVTVSTRIMDGYLLPIYCAAFAELAPNSQVVYPDATDPHRVMSCMLPVGTVPLTPGNKLTVSTASNVESMLISPVSPTRKDLLLLVNQTLVGVYQYTTTWIYLGSTTQSLQLTSVVSTGKTTGFRRDLPYDGFVAQVVKSPPTTLEPFKLYVDTALNLIYFPYSTAATIESPYTVVSIYSPLICSMLTVDTEVLISPLGYKQITTLPDGTSYIFITYSGLTSPVESQPCAIYGSNKVLLQDQHLSITQKLIDYSIIQGVTEVEYQLASGYYRGGNNLWDTVTVKTGSLNRPLLTSVVEKSPYAVSVVNLSFTRTNIFGGTVYLYIYIGNPDYITADDIVFKVNIKYFSTITIPNIRVMQGESILIKTTTGVNLTYRYTQLSRSI